MVTVVVMLFLIATVVFALSQMLNVSSGNVIDGQRQGDSTAALFLAESGLEKAQATLAAALSGNVSDASCTGVPAAAAAPYALGRGTVALPGAVSTPANCNNSGAPGTTPCSSCTVTATGSVGVTTRTVTQALALTVKNGVTCSTGCGNSPVTWQLKLRNASAVAGIGIFNLAYDQQGNNAATCAVGSNCRLQLAVNSPNNGSGSIGLQGNAVLIPAGATYPIYQTMSKDHSLAEVGTFFLGSTAPTLTGPTASPGAASYWNRDTTVATSIATVGSTNDGTATSGGSCSAPSANAQTCTSWCYGGDTLVFSVANKVTALTDQLGSVVFGTNPSVGQNVPMTLVAKFPTPAVVGAPVIVDAEIWNARNPNFTPASTPLAVNASSYKGRGSGAVGAAWTTTSATETAILTSGILGNGTLTISSASAFTGTWPAQMILPGDAVTSTSGAVTITATIGTQSGSVETGALTTGQGGRGTYNVSNIRNNGALVVTSGTTFNGNNRLWTVNSNVLNVSACTICFFAQNDPITLVGLSAGRTINAVQAPQVTTFGRTEVAGGLGRYPISDVATRVASGGTLFAGTPGATLYLPSTSSQPTVTAPPMRVALKTGSGVLVPNTTVTAVSAANAATTAFTVSTAPTTVLDGASLCGGTCAFFVPSGTTNFTLTPAVGVPAGNFESWAGGFTCLKGVDLTPQVVTSSTTSAGRWTEVVY